jgi:hypothetical protein
MDILRGLYTTSETPPNFQAANPAGGVPMGTEVTVAFLRDVYGELLNILAAAGIGYATGTPTQVLASLRLLLAGLNGNSSEIFAALGIETDSVSSLVAASPLFLQSDGYTASVNHGNTAYVEHYIAPGTVAQAAVNLGQFLFSATTNGCAEFPGGFVVQWGFASVTSSSGGPVGTAVTLPLAYATEHLFAHANWGGASPPSTGNVAGEPLSQSQIFITTNAPTAPSLGVSYLSFGK